MAIGEALIILIFIIGGIVFLADRLMSRADSHPQLVAENNRLRKRAGIGEKALRTIAGGAAMPVIEAEDALSQIEKTYDSKELY